MTAKEIAQEAARAAALIEQARLIVRRLHAEACLETELAKREGLETEASLWRVVELRLTDVWLKEGLSAQVKCSLVEKEITKAYQ